MDTHMLSMWAALLKERAPLTQFPAWAKEEAGGGQVEPFLLGS